MLYEMTVPAYRNGLRALSAQLDKALAWGTDNGVGELQFVAARLAPDMFPLASQVRFSCQQAIQALTRLGASGAPAFAEDAADFAGLQAQIADTLAWLDTVDAAAIDADPGRAVGFDLPNGATRLARGDVYENQAIRYGENAWGIQFHGELTLAMMHRWVVRGAHRFDLPGAQIGRAHLDGRLLHDAALRIWMASFLDQVFHEV